MRIVCVGGGPAGMYFAILAKLRDPRHEVAVIERNPAGATHGWGVVFWDALLDDLYRNDPVSADEVRKASVLYEGQEVRLRDDATAYLGGYGFSVNRRSMLEVLTARARDLGIDVQFEREVTDLSELGDVDLLVASDGVNSPIRERYAEDFETRVAVGRNKYIWLGTTKVFDAFTFAFEETAAGWIWFHAYPSASGNSTCIVECAPQTWSALGLDTLGGDEGVARLEQIFARPLSGHSLLNRAQGMGEAHWLSFREISNRRWYRGNIVLMGDAAHTTHFSIGSGTKLAIHDAIALHEVLPGEAADLPPRLRSYDESRRVTLRATQDAAHKSMTWFENLDENIEDDPVQFAYALWKRRGNYPRWRYQLHLATQISALRRVRREVSSARRSLLAHKRGERGRVRAR
jgi:anthraniloyl-CoA monooxygenase